MSNGISKENILRVLEFLPYFEWKENKFYETDIEVSIFDPYVYSSKVLSFIGVLYENNFIEPFDWASWQEEAKKYVDDSTILSVANIDVIKKLLTIHDRKDRFCSGHLASMIDCGHILAILRRLSAIYKKY
jgi:O-acetyl-ADP-ribose deacetylase